MRAARRAFLLFVMVLIAAACGESLSEPTAIEPRNPVIGVWGVSDVEAEKLGLPKLEFAGEKFDPFCETAPPFIAQQTSNGFLLTRVDQAAPSAGVSYFSWPNRARCEALYNSCVARCRPLKGRAGALCYSACMTAYATCLGGSYLF